MLLKVLTYNIHKGIGGIDRRYELQRVMDVVGHYEPDVALLQEVDNGVPRSGQHCQFELLGEALGFNHVAFQPNVHLRQGHYGNALLSRYPMRRTTNVELTVRPKKRRRALVAEIVVSNRQVTRTVVVTNLHLGLADFERRIQLRRLLGDDALTHHRLDTPLIVGGDFNDVWGNLGKRMMAPAGFRLATGQYRTFPARMPLRALDAIYLRGDVAVDHAFAGHTDVCRHASDHLPLVAHLEVAVG